MEIAKKDPEYPTIYTTSDHFDTDPTIEVDNALAAGNSHESVYATLEARQRAELGNDPESARVKAQLEHLASLATVSGLAA